MGSNLLAVKRASSATMVSHSGTFNKFNPSFLVSSTGSFLWPNTMHVDCRQSPRCHSCLSSCIYRGPMGEVLRRRLHSSRLNGSMRHAVESESPFSMYARPYHAVAIVGIPNQTTAVRGPSAFVTKWRSFRLFALSEMQSSTTIYRLKAEVSNQQVAAKEEGATLRKGALLEFQKDSGKTTLGVAQCREGKRNWIVVDQRGETYTVRPNQINFIVPGVEDFNPADLNDLLCKTEELLREVALLEMAWEETVVKNKPVNVEELSLIIYGKITPGSCYSTYRMVSSNTIYFSCKVKGYVPIYEPRSPVQVGELRLQQLRKASKHDTLMELASAIKSAIEAPFSEKPPQDFWTSNEKFKKLFNSLKSYALEDCHDSEEKNSAMKVLEELKVNKTTSDASDLLIHIGYFPLHVNLELLKSKLPVNFSSDVILEAEALKTCPPSDLDKDNRVDLTSLKVYTIDSDDPDEIDDGLSAVQLPDGHIKVWIHVADPTRWVDCKSLLKREASRRCTSIYLPTRTISMFPLVLAQGLMSLRQGFSCPAVSIAVSLSQDGSIAEYTVENSLIRPTYKLSYEAASELLSLGVEEEAELSLLYKAAMLRRNWRFSQGATDLFTPCVRIRASDDYSLEPTITISVEEQMSPASQVVSEMMILCGEVISALGGKKRLALPYRGQLKNGELRNRLQDLPEGPARSMAMIRSMHSADMSFVRPLEHASLGLRGYVQFTSPIRRYTDLLAHYQVKAVIRGENPPFSSGQIEAAMSTVNLKARLAKRLQSESERYWMLEYLRRQPRERKYRAIVFRFLKDTNAIVLLIEVGIKGSVDLHSKARIGEEVFVHVVEAHSRKGILMLKEV